MRDDEVDDVLGGPHTRRQVLKGAGAASLTLGAGGLLAACGGGGNSSGGGGSPGTGGSPASTGKPKKGGELRIGVQAGSNKETQDAHTPNTDPELAWASNLYEPVAQYMPDGKFALVLAESFQATDPSTWVVKLKPGVEFHNGKTVTADDVIFSIKRIVDPKTASRGGGGLALVDLAGLKKLDDLTVQIPLKEPNSVFDAEFGQYFNGIVPTDYDPKHPVGTGPYKADTFTAGQQATLLRFANYHGAPGYVDKITITELADAGARVNALLSGQVDAIAALPGAQVKTLESNKQFTVLNAETGTWIPISMHVDKKPLSDVRVRQALRLLVDRKQMLSQVLNGYGQLGNDTWGRTDPTYDTSLPQRQQDLEQAKSLLQQAGQSDLRIELTTSPFYEGMVSSAQVFVEQAKAAGVTVKLTQLDTDAFLANYLKWPFTQGYWGTRDYIPQAAQITLPGATLNDTGWDDKEYTSVVGAAKKELDVAKRKELIAKAQQIDYDRGSYIVWGFANVIDAYSKKLAPIEPGHFQSLGNYQLARIGFAA
jgi:peptide/nickel transport system substrate-binding protein